MAQSAPAAYLQANEIAVIDAAKLDPIRFGELYDRHFGQIYRFAYARVRDQATAEDITSEVFVKALAALPRFRHSGRPFHAWLYRIAFNTITDSARSTNRSVALECVDEAQAASDDSTVEVALRRYDIDRVWRRVATLPTDQRTAITLKFRDDLAIKDIAFAMGRSNGAAKLLLHRGLARLRRDLAAER
ncbi:MAG TPA: sigma-70 family RNA polymerase sigma factor [Candidatus Dormibacteraeota bacterium]|nr:sigma-70 family RNA polymerase sigma factor [Candidatus Dormibacteraeota bacterium]